MECKNCKKFNDNCGHHFIDSHGHINYNIPAEVACDKYGDCMFYDENRSRYEKALEFFEKKECMDRAAYTHSPYINEAIEALKAMIKKEKGS